MATPADDLAASPPGRDAVAAALRRILPQEAVLADDESVRPYECDGLSAYRRLPLAVALPDTVQQVRRDDERLGRRSRPTDFRGEPLLQELETQHRSRRLIAELKAAQRIWLKEQGYILKVRTHVNSERLGGADMYPAAGGATPIAPTEPRGVIRVRPKENDSERRAETPVISVPTVRVSVPENSRPEPVVVVRTQRADAPSE